MAQLEAIRARIAALEAGTRTPSPALPFGHEAIDACLPGGGLPLGRWHELTGEGMELETAAATAGFAALMARPLAARGHVVWVMRRGDLYAPGLAFLGFPADRLIQVAARDQAEALAVLEDALATVGVAAAIGEVEPVDLVAGRRLQLACEKRGSTGLLLHRRFSAAAARRGGAAGGSRQASSGSAAATRWKITSAPAAADGQWGIGAARWTVELQRCRGGRPGAWLMEEWKDDAPHPLRMVADLADRHLAAEEPANLERGPGRLAG
jgi:protein ImuA